MVDPVWTYASIWEAVARAVPDEPAFIQDDMALSWGAFDAAADGLAAWYVRAGLGHQSKVAVYTVNCPEYLIAYHAAFKAGIVPFNVNYRYGADEVTYLIENGDAEAVVFETAFSDVVAEVRRRRPEVKLWIAVPDGEAPVPSWAMDFRVVASTPAPQRPFMAPWGRSPEDLLILYTGGTTGMPKGVMWRQGDLIGMADYGANEALGLGPLSSPEEAGTRAASLPFRPRSIIGPPLMHGTGQLTAIAALGMGGAVLLLPRGGFNPVTLWDMVDTYKATGVTIVGQPFAKPMLEVLDAHPGHWDLSSVLTIVSSGAMWNMENKRGLLRHMPQVSLVDSFGSSEAVRLGSSIMTAAEEVQTARFTLGPNCVVFNEDWEEVKPGSGETGRVALGGFIPVGYYKDEAKTAATFPEIHGRRWSMPGDWAQIDADGTLILLGRGSQCINTGGEKVYPEEVEEALKLHPAVRDAAVVGLPDPRFGERIVALVEVFEDMDNPDDMELRDHVRDRLAPYKAPRQILYVESVTRAPNGKLDYKGVKARALEAFGDDADGGQDKPT